ncbi:MAG: hypothetical protein GX173_00500 [Ruminococcaceae bacterium]|nr:hypothetical protein [Oscillospiraceae bacterium]
MDFYIMNRDIVVAKWENRQFTLLKKELAPLYLVNTGNVEHWLETRAIDEHRANSRLLKKALRLTERDDISTVISVNAVTITDNYWIKPLDSDLAYDDVRFDNDYFANLALRGGYDSFNKAANSKRSRTPELTNIGSFEKCWKLKDGEWWMHKTADHNQQFSEIFVYELGKHLGFNMAGYERGDKCVKTKDFTDNAAVNFESAYGFMNDNEDYIDVVKKLREIAPHTIPDYVRMIFLDTIVANPDRHTNNFGLLRNVKTGKILSLAPNFDNNMALISRGYPKNIERKNDALVRFFNQLLAFDPSLKKYIPNLTEQDIRMVLKQVNMKVKSDIIVRFVLNGYNQIARDK